MWTLTPIGTGSAFNTKELQSNFIIEKDGKKLLIDCGSFAPLAFERAGLKPTDIDGVYVSHLHADHVGGLEWLAFSTYFVPNAPRPKLYGNGKLLRQLWNDTLKGGLESIQTKECTLTDYFECKPVRPNIFFTWQYIKFQLVQTVHIMNGFEIVHSYGLMIQEKQINNSVSIYPKVFLTTDTQFCPNQIQDFYNTADVILQDCETSDFKSGVHAHYSDLIKLPDETRKKMHLYHYQSIEKLEQEAGFRGFLIPRQVLEFK